QVQSVRHLRRGLPYRSPGIQPGVRVGQQKRGRFSLRPSETAGGQGMIYYRYIAEALFVLFTLITFTGGYIALTARYLMNAVLGLALALLGVAGLYFHLGSPF